MATRISLFLACILALALPSYAVPSVSAANNAIAPAYTGCGGVTPVATNPAYEQAVVELVNAERWEHGQLPPYKRVTALDSAARYHSVDMEKDDYFDHDSHDRSSGSLVFACYWYERVASYYSSSMTMAENIAKGPADPASVMVAWMNSSGHQANILSSDYWEIGVGYTSGSSGIYWTQDFGRRYEVYPLVINREAASTNSPNVSLYIYGAGTFEQMHLKNEDGAWTAWQPFQSDLAWTLSPGSGTKTVTAELKYGTTITTSSDTITLTTTFNNFLYIPAVKR